MRIIIYIFLGFIALLGLTFACLNASPVALNYYVGQITWPLSLLLLVAFTIGGIVGLLLSSTSYLRLKIENSRLNQQIKSLEKELVNRNTMIRLPAQVEKF